MKIPFLGVVVISLFSFNALAEDSVTCRGWLSLAGDGHGLEKASITFTPTAEKAEQQELKFSHGVKFSIYFHTPSQPNGFHFLYATLIGTDPDGKPRVYGVFSQKHTEENYGETLEITINNPEIYTQALRSGLGTGPGFVSDLVDAGLIQDGTVSFATVRCSIERAQERTNISNH